MTIVRWNPRETRPLDQTMARTFDDFFNGYGSWPGLDFPWNTLRGNANVAWEPFVDIYETADEVVVHAELPGMNRDDIELTVEKGVLTLSGQRPAGNEAPADNYIRLERRYGRFTRSFTLPGLVDSDNIKAEYTDGILTVRLPKVESAKPRRIQIVA